MTQSQQLLKEIQHETVLTMNGTSLEDVVGKLFQAMRKQLFHDFGKPIIHREAKEVYFENVKTHKTTEKFMFLFWPREKVSYEITARIVVSVKYLDVTKEEL